MFSYTPRPSSKDPQILDNMNRARDLTYKLKQDRVVPVTGIKQDIPMSDYVSEVIKRNLSLLPFSDFFTDAPVLVPVPKSTPIPSSGLWVPDRIANSLVRKGLGSAVVPCLVRTTSVNKSAQTNAGSRPSPTEHYDSFSVGSIITRLDNVVLIDDVITRGSTLTGAVNKLADAHKGIRICGLAAIRTISDPSGFSKWMDPVKGIITLRSSGDTIRRP